MTDDANVRPPVRRIAVFSRGIERTPHIASLLGADDVVGRPSDQESGRIDAVVGWGHKPNTRMAMRFARRHQLPYWRAEDGFLRSVGLGADGAPPLSVVLDDVGIYYDATRPSRLEVMLAGSADSDPLDEPVILARARRAIDRIRDAQLSKYNSSPTTSVDLGPARAAERVLIVDQTRGDLSIECGLASASTFRRMLDTARLDHPRAELIVKVHPDVLAGKKQAHLADAAGEPNVRIWATSANPIAVLEQVDHVYVVTSQLGFEALMVGKPVTCFGAPFYAGWGLTDDRCAIPRRTRTRSVEQVFAAAYILYARYVDPDTGRACQLERIIEHLTLQREQFSRNDGSIFCFGFQLWKRNYVRAYLRSPGNRVLFPRNAEHAERLGFDESSKLLVWGLRDNMATQRLRARHDVPLWRMEDGFLRSVGLGSDLDVPASLVVDREGIYFDPRRPSELEMILQARAFSHDELTRARALRTRIADAELSKYNVGKPLRISVPDGKNVILVPGQVEDDASIRLGCRDVRTNRALLAAVRHQNPDAFIIYKPHPDVVSGNRTRGVPVSEAGLLCDHVEEHASLAACLRVANAVHTMTSTVGFEALIRELEVVTYGQPFYAGWGLTRDHHPVSRRTRHLTHDELAAGVLICYPRYLNRRSFEFTTPEAVVSSLTKQRDGDAAARALHMSWPKRQLRKLVHAYKGMTHAP